MLLCGSSGIVALRPVSCWSLGDCTASRQPESRPCARGMSVCRRVGRSRGLPGAENGCHCVGRLRPPQVHKAARFRRHKSGGLKQCSGKLRQSQALGRIPGQSQTCPSESGPPRPRGEWVPPTPRAPAGATECHGMWILGPFPYSHFLAACCPALPRCTGCAQYTSPQESYRVLHVGRPALRWPRCRSEWHCGHRDYDSSGAMHKPLIAYLANSRAAVGRNHCVPAPELLRHSVARSQARKPTVEVRDGRTDLRTDGRS